MSEKPTRWDYITTGITATLCGFWAVYEYQADPLKIPFEPAIAFITGAFAIWGYSRWKRNSADTPTTTTQSENVVTDAKIEAERDVHIGNKIDNSENVVTDAKIEAGRDVHIGNKTVIYKDAREIPRLLTNPPFNADVFIGRTKDLSDIETQYQDHNRLLILVNGEGGIGKTTLAAKYWYAHAARYKHLAWLYADTGIGAALVTLKDALGIDFGPEDDFEAQIHRITVAINQLDTPCLLVFDNANKADDLKKYYTTLHQLPNCHILLTSRVSQLANMKVHKVLPLSEPEAVDLFKKYYPELPDADLPMLHDVLKAVGYNTLVTELLAKNLAVLNRFAVRYPLADLLRDLQAKGLLALKNKAVAVVYGSDKLREAEPTEVISAMYDLVALADGERQVLSNLAVLPAENLAYALVPALLNADEEALEQALRSLEEKGWLEYRKADHTFKISPVIQEVTRRKNADHLLRDCRTLVHTLTTGLNKENRHTNNYQQATVFARLGAAVIYALPIDFNVATLCQNIGNYHRDTGNLYLTLQAYQKMVDIQTALYAAEPDKAHFKNGLAISYEKLGETHSSLGNLEKALEFFEQRNKLGQELYDEYPNHVDFKNGLAISYAKLGETHSSLGNLEKALEFFEQYNRLEKELYDEYPNHVAFKNGLAISYEKLGQTHSSLGNLEKALEFFEKDIELSKELYDEYPNNVAFKNGLAISYSKLGETHSSLGNLEKALEFFEQRNKLGQELYDEYPNHVAFKNGLAISYSKLGETHSSLGNLEKALEFFEVETKLFEELYDEYPNHVAFKNGLAISYYKLGQLYEKKGNLEKAFENFEQDLKFSELTYRTSPNNAQFKRYLKISYKQMGDISKKMGKNKLAEEYYKQAKALE